MAVWEFNRGEWTEAYVFLRLLGEGRIYGASAELVRDDKIYIDIVNVIRAEPNAYARFERFIENEIAKVKAFDKDNVIFKVITGPELNEKASFLYHEIMASSGGKRKLKVPAIQEYLEELRFSSPKANLSDEAKQAYGAKADIIITAQNSLDNSTSTEGFSVKSHLGSNPTLFNCSQTSGFVYRIVGCNLEGMHRINALNSLKTMIAAIKKDYSLEYVGCRNAVFEQNIGIVDSRMDEILNVAILAVNGYYNHDISTDLPTVCDTLTNLNPIKRANPKEFYSAKIKDFLFASFAGLTASTPWSGRKKLTGGYIDVGQTGELLYYRAISDDIFANYLFKNTKIDMPDRGVCKALALERAGIYLSEHRNLTKDEENAIIFVDGISGKKNSKKGDFGYVYEKDNEFFIDLNFQIRFR
ncbi:MAG: HpaII family restriction endonuclease [Aeriscardovia sp.]|nr:HpaII family restriction endonuclease [Aeriscardovia sp.]